MPSWGPLGQQVFNRTYSRPTAEGSESWHQTVSRVVEGNLDLVDAQHIEPLEATNLARHFENFSALPAGRHLWVSGVPGRQFLFNCHRSGFGPNLADHFCFTFDELMKGGGVGSNYSTTASKTALAWFGPAVRILSRNSASISTEMFVDQCSFGSDLQLMKSKMSGSFQCLMLIRAERLTFPATTQLAIW